MINADIRLDITEYVKEFKDEIIESLENGITTIHVTNNENILISIKETFDVESTKEERNDNSKVFDMVKFVITKSKGIISGETIKSILSKRDLVKIECLQRELVGNCL